MMSSSDFQAKPMNTDDNPSSGGSRKTGSSVKQQQQQPPEQAVLKCPRCDSSNTKFCYYNNYSLTQPRHFCKTCRRYWTRGGALRNVPIGGGCRKNKKTKSSSRLSGHHDYSKEYSPSSSSENIGGGGGLKFFHHHGISSPSMEFQLGGGGGLPFTSRLHSSSTSGVYNNNNQFAASYGDHHQTNPSFMGFNFPGSSSSVLSTNINGGMIQAVEMGNSLNLHSNLATSIESLSCINQDLHWKLQQQRLGMLFGGGGAAAAAAGENNNQKESNDDLHETGLNQTEKPQPILFQNLEMSKSEALALSNIPRKSGSSVGGNPNTEWFFENSTSYTPNTNTTTTTTNNNNNNNNNSNQENDNRSSWDGIQVWSTGLNHQFTGLPE